MTSNAYQSFKHGQVWIKNSDPEIRILYVETNPPSSEKLKGTILLIHGFPETSYRFRKVMEPLSSASYRVIAPDYRGAGYSSYPDSGFTKDVLSSDLYELTSILSIQTPHPNRLARHRRHDRPRLSGSVSQGHRFSDLGRVSSPRNILL